MAVLQTVLSTLPAAHRGLLDFVNLYPDSQPNFYQNFVGRTLSTKELYEEIAQVGGFRPALPMSDGGGIQFDTVQTPYQKKFFPVIYSLGWEVTPKAMYNDPYGVLAKQKAGLGRSMYIALEQSGAAIVNNATNSSYTGIDGKVLAATDHPTSSSTFSNLSTAATLSIGSLETMIQDVAAHKAYRDYAYMYQGPWNLTVTKENWMLAKRITETMSQPGTANNDKNVARGFFRGVNYNPFLTSTTAYILTPASDEDNPIFQLSGMPLTMWESKDLRTPSHVFAMFKEWCFGWTQAQGIQFNAGA